MRMITHTYIYIVQEAMYTDKVKCDCLSLQLQYSIFFWYFPFIQVN